MARNTPWEWEHLICSCEESQHILNSNICGKCEKYHRYALLPCAECRQQFIKNFKHPQWCPCKPKCWACCNELEFAGEPYCERKRCVARRPSVIVFPPEGEEPREALALEDALDVNFDLDF